jgi:nucleoside diphosphate-linked moiety X motif protein 19
MPNSICFPGGGTDKTDESKEWVNFLKHHKIPTEELRRKPGTKRPFIYDHREGLLDREVSLRLTAIRETFEELGVVICRDPSDSPTSPFSSFYHAKDCDVPLWQKKIHNHQESLLSFSEKFKVVPDIMNVHEWSCWLTPTFFRPKRFETAFFLVALNSVPPIYPETHEVQEFRVSLLFEKIVQVVKFLFLLVGYA